ncbi:MAG: acyl-CoA thioesterase [Halobacteriovoraceae bacterium]|jgi:acyl-CoA thioesterase YciA|nr:acyl-CoA thioesterase [Halobacteriovoraceae bacterium]
MTDKKSSATPKGELSIRVLAMPESTNPAGDIFGGWVLSQMDIAGGIVTKKFSKGRTVTIAVNSMTFLKPVLVGDTLCCYVDILKVGTTSIKVNIETWVARQYEEEREKVTEGVFTYVAVCPNRKPRAIEEKCKVKCI